MRRVLMVPALAILLTGATPVRFGGWAVITVQDLPEYLVAGRSTDITFTVLQHGESPMNDLKPTITLRQNGERRLWGRESVRARRAADPGQYVATLSIQDTGQVVITIDANWHTASTTLLPLRVVPAGVAAAALAPEVRGRDLFVAKGCVGCHMKRDDRKLAGRNDAQVGPDLTGRGFAKEWLVTKLADPARNRVQYSEWARMPDLDLNEREIAALVSYINRPQSEAASGSPAPKSGS